MEGIKSSLRMVGGWGDDIRRKASNGWQHCKAKSGHQKELSVAKGLPASCMVAGGEGWC